LNFFKEFDLMGSGWIEDLGKCLEDWTNVYNIGAGENGGITSSESFEETKQTGKCFSIEGFDMISESKFVV
jgi:hypothetical protein